MATAYTRKKLTELEDMGAKSGLEGIQEARFATSDLEAAETGVSHQRLMPGKRQQFGHKHENAEEVYVVLSGAGRVKLDDDILEIEQLDAIRVAPKVIRAFEAGPDGMEILAFGTHRKGDGELIQGWWSD